MNIYDDENSQPESEPEDTYGSNDDQTTEPDVSSGDSGNDTEGTEDDNS